ncbi:MAG: ribonuclease R [Patescibacteria group bacterium]
MEHQPIIGQITVSSRGTGYFKIPGDDKVTEDIEIDNQFLRTALNGDEVEVVLLPRVKSAPSGKEKGREERQKGEVVRVISRARDNFVGVVEINAGVFVVPDDRRMYRDILIPASESMGSKAGDKVHVKLFAWTDPKKNPEGKIIKIIGRKGDHNTEMEAIVIESGFESSFSKEVLAEAEEVANRERARMSEETNEKISSRTDLRGITTFTIDPFDAKDFDDAISVKKIKGDKENKTGDNTGGRENLYEIGVHIADVSHYVRPGGALDAEARKRGLSVYLVDRTISMLPEVLSNDLCSLNEKVDRLAFSAIFTMKENGEILKRWFGKSTINSDKRFTYENAQEVMDKKSGPFLEELLILNKIAHALRKVKFAAGAIDFETTEVKFKLDDKGKPISVYKKERLDTHKLVEDFMLLANREVAEFIFKAHKEKRGAGIYRIHDLPDPQKITDLSLFLKALGFDLKNTDGKTTSRDINDILRQAENSPQSELIKTATIRSMSKAIYSTKNIGHFGLAFRFYTHFTSPIRRYPDLIVHRILEQELKGAPMDADEFARLERIAVESSTREISAAEAERASIKYKQVEYMGARIGQVFDGKISGVAEFGIFVEETETGCEGMVRLRDLGNDFYVLDKKSYAIVGEKTGKRYSLGDKVKFKVVGADLERRALDYVFV